MSNTDVDEQGDGWVQTSRAFQVRPEKPWQGSSIRRPY